MNLTRAFIAAAAALAVSAAMLPLISSAQSPAPPVQQSPALTKAQADAARFEAGVGRAGWIFGPSANGKDKAERKWLNAYADKDPTRRAALDKARFAAELRRGAPSGNSYDKKFTRAYALTPEGTAMWNAHTAKEAAERASQQASFRSNLSSASSANKAQTARTALNLADQDAVAWWNANNGDLSGTDTNAFDWCNRGVQAACPAAEGHLEAISRAAGATQDHAGASASSSSASTNPADATQALKDRNAAVNRENCARASSGASITCNP